MRISFSFFVRCKYFLTRARKRTKTLCEKQPLQDTNKTHIFPFLKLDKILTKDVFLCFAKFCDQAWLVTRLEIEKTVVLTFKHFLKTSYLFELISYEKKFNIHRCTEWKLRKFEIFYSNVFCRQQSHWIHINKMVLSAGSKNVYFS